MSYNITIRKLPNGIEEQTTTFQDGSTLVYLNGVLQTPGGYTPAPQTPRWRKWYAWRPVRVEGRWHWLETVYRYWVLSPGGGFWQYGTILDVLKNNSNTVTFT